MTGSTSGIGLGIARALAGAGSAVVLNGLGVASEIASVRDQIAAEFHTMRLALPSMRENGFGRIINIASAHGLVASPFKAAYVAAKHGVVGLTRATALETAEDGITCHPICPGYVYSPLVEAQIDGQAKAHGISRDQVIRDVLLAQQPNKRFVTVEEAERADRLPRRRRRSVLTGIALPVDGGWTAH
ncbi:MAG: SDR family oxidoreductase [Bradyrhizobium sp.]|nr:SDR family oxidoreductase [Bradyrhizobium sp.]